MSNEINQLEHGPIPGKRLLRAIYPDTMSSEEKKKALNAINLINKKRDVMIKGITCTDWSKQHIYLK